MLWATLLYTRNGAFTLTCWPFWYSCVGRTTEPAGPVPLIPNRLWSCVASWLCPHADSSIACAIVTAAGMPYCRCAASAPGATWLIKACCAAEPGTDAELAATGVRPYRGLELPAPEVAGPEPAEE